MVIVGNVNPAATAVMRASLNQSNAIQASERVRQPMDRDRRKSDVQALPAGCLLALARTLSSGEYLSLGDLAARMDLSPEDVRRGIDVLKSQGVKVIEECGIRYRLDAPLDLLDGNLLRRELADRAPDLVVELVDECDSTSELLASRLATAPGGTVLTCEYQRAGHGRRGHRWTSGLAASLTFSLLWRFGGGSTALSGLSLAVAVAVSQALERRGLSGISLKWPNDLLFRGRKLGGILIEVSGSPHGSSTAIIGIGLNVRLPVEVHAVIDRPVTDLAEVASIGVGNGNSSPLPDRGALLGEVLTALAVMLPRYEQAGFAAFRAAWEERHAHRGKQVLLLRDSLTIAEGEAVGVAEDGSLLLRTARGLERFHSGEVSLRTSGLGT